VKFILKSTESPLDFSTNPSTKLHLSITITNRSPSTFNPPPLKVSLIFYGQQKIALPFFISL
jgi:hypothetical protein